MKKLQHALGDEAETPRYIETLPRHGYRFIVTLNGRVSPELLPNERPPSPAATPCAASIFAHWLTWTTIAACLIATVLAVRYAWHLRSGRAANVDSIALLPFVNAAGDADTEYLSMGVTESLIHNLARVPQLKVKSRYSVFSYTGKEVNIQKIGRELGVTAVVIGRVVPTGDRLDVSAELADVRDNSEICGQHYSIKRTDIIFLQQQIASELAVNLRYKLRASEATQITRQGTLDPEAYELYLKGRYCWNKRTPSRIAMAISYFNQAISKDPR